MTYMLVGRYRLTYIKLGKVTYNVGLEKGARLTTEARRDVIYKIVLFNDRITHNHLWQIVVQHLHAMAKRTCEKHLKSMVSERLITVLSRGKKKLYSAAQYHDIYVYTESINRRLNNLESLIIELEKNFKDYSAVKQNTVAANMVKAIRDVDACIWICERLEGYPDSKQNRLRLAKLYKTCDNLVTTIHRPYEESLGRWPFFFSILDLDAFNSFNTLKKFINFSDDEYLKIK